MSESDIAGRLQAVPDVDIDEGRFKYVLIKVYASTDSNETFKHIVRGYCRADFHADVYEEVYDRVRGLGLDTECIGGGRIKHNTKDRTLEVFGYSQGYGKADHSISCEILKKEYPNYKITWSDEGY